MKSEKALLIQSQTKEVSENLGKIKDMLVGNIGILTDNLKIAKALGRTDIQNSCSRAILDLQSALSGLRCATGMMEDITKTVNRLQ